MAAVAACLDAVGSGPAGLVLEGAAGIGKTTVWAAGAGLAARRGFTVLSCRPAESEARLSFAALGDLLGGVLEEALAGLPPPQRRALGVGMVVEDQAGRPPEKDAGWGDVLGVICSLVWLDYYGWRV